MHRSPIFSCLLLCLASGPLEPSQAAAAVHESIRFTTLNQLGALVAGKAPASGSFRVEAAVTYFDAEWNLLYLQDESGSLYLDPASLPGELLHAIRPGRLVCLEGVAESGQWRFERIEAVGPALMPVPLDGGGAEAFNPADDGFWARMTGWISGMRFEGNRVNFELTLRPGKSLTVIVPAAPVESARRFSHSLAEVSGVFSAERSLEGKPTGNYSLFVADLSEIRRIRALPVTPAGEVSKRAGDVRSGEEEPVLLHGTVASHHLGRFLLLEDGSGSVRVEFKDLARFASGSLVEVFAYPRHQGGALELIHARIRSIGAQAELESPPRKFPSPTEANRDLPELVRIAPIRALSAREASRGYPVRVQGILTYYDPHPQRHSHFIQDHSAGIYFDTGGRGFDVQPGQQVEIIGFSHPGDFAPTIMAERIQVLGEAAFPAPQHTTLRGLMTGGEDSQWVALHGLVRSQTVENDLTILMLSTEEASVRVTVPDAGRQPAPMDLVDAMVEVRGVCSTVFNEHRQLQGVALHAPDWRQVTVQTPPPTDPALRPVQPIAELLQFSSSRRLFPRARVQGMVTLQQANGSFFVQDASGALRVQPQQFSPVRPGDWVEATGFPFRADGLPVLQDAVVQALPERLPLEPAPLDPAFPLDPNFHGALAQLEGRVIGRFSRTAEEILIVQFGEWLTDAILEKQYPEPQMDGIAPGSVVRLTGAYAARVDESGKVQSFQLLLRSPEDVVLLSRPSWWTARNTFWVLGAVAAALLITLGWVEALRRQVRQRTRDLDLEIEEHKGTEAKLLTEIAERKRVELQVEKTHRELLAASRQAGMAEVATGVLHNVGNVLNSVNVSATIITDLHRKSRLPNLAKVAALLMEHQADLPAFLTSDPKGKQVPAYLAQLSGHLRQEQETGGAELEALRQNLEHIKEIVAMQQSYAQVSGVTESIQVTSLVEDSLRVNGAALVRHGIEVVREYVDQPVILVEKHKVLQILVNLVHNAKYACEESGRPDKRLTVRVTNGGARVQVAVLDNGIGIPAENLTQIFSYGFTTRKGGHGFGLHCGALAARELGGALTVRSDGPGRGAAFTLELPLDKS